MQNKFIKSCQALRMIWYFPVTEKMLLVLIADVWLRAKLLSWDTTITLIQKIAVALSGFLLNASAES